jgi:hypothetical protein
MRHGRDQLIASAGNSLRLAPVRRNELQADAINWSLPYDERGAAINPDLRSGDVASRV